MALDMEIERKQMSKHMRDLIAQFMEHAGVDAIVVNCSTVRRNSTRTYMGMRGNVFACRGLAEELYNEIHADDESTGEEAAEGDSGTE